MEQTDITSLWPGVELNEKYEIVQMMGRGAYGCVYKVFDKLTKKELAIKLSKKKRVLLQEYNIMRNLHLVVSVPVVYEKFEIGKALGIVMDICLEDLSKLVSRNMTCRFCPKTCLKILYHLIVALKSLHNSRIVHADIKPGNICLSTHFHSSWPIKLVDLGNAKVIGNEPNGVNDLYRNCQYATHHLQNGHHPNRRDDILMALYSIFDLSDYKPWDFNNFTRLFVQKKKFELDSKSIFEEEDEKWLKTLSFDFVNCNPATDEPNYDACFRGIRSAIDGFRPEKYKLPVLLDPITQLLVLK